MNRKWVYALVVVCLLGVLGAGSLRVYRHYKGKRDQMWEATGSLPLIRPLDDEEMKKFLADENKMLGGDEILLPVVRQLGLVAAFHVGGETEAVKRLREHCEVRKGGPAVVLLIFRDHDRDLAAKVGKCLEDVYIRAHKKAPDSADVSSTGL